MTETILLVGAIGFGIVASLVLMLRRRFSTHLGRLDTALRAPGNGTGPRSDLPPKVTALALRLGARAKDVPAIVEFAQSGQMWRQPGGKPIAFTARQTMRVGSPGFMWCASLGPVRVADYLIDGIGGLEVMLFGAFPISRMIGGAAANQGEALRYLAELPWCPDAILANRSLDWTVLDETTIKVATGVGASRGEVTFELDDAGLIVGASAPSRVYSERNGQTTDYPWHGRFWDYQSSGEWLIPMQGEVAWGLPAGDFVYWRGKRSRD